MKWNLKLHDLCVDNKLCVKIDCCIRYMRIVKWIEKLSLQCFAYTWWKWSFLKHMFQVYSVHSLQFNAHEFWSFIVILTANNWRPYLPTIYWKRIFSSISNQLKEKLSHIQIAKSTVCFPKHVFPQNHINSKPNFHLLTQFWESIHKHKTKTAFCISHNRTQK